MYNNSRYRQRTSIRHIGSGNGFSRPTRPAGGPSRPQGGFSGRGRFNNTRFNSNNRGGVQRKSQLEGANIEMFIKKATPILDQETSSDTSFEDFDIIQNLKVNIKTHGYSKPTPIQSQAIKPILEGRDVIGLASTGTGKTAAFLIPLINKLFKERNQRALIIVPTRELAVQISEEFRYFAYGMQIYSALLIGGANMYRQISDLKRSAQIVIATPGRLKDLIERRAIYLQDFSNIVLDEVDLMVDIGFIADVKYFISQMPKVRQSLFFSATIPPKVQGVLQSFVTNPVTVSVKKQETSENVNQDVVKIGNSSQKLDKLHDLLITEGFDKVLVFLRTKHSIDRLHRELESRGFNKIGAIHGNKSQGQRQRILQSFKRDEIKVLLATDVASRGLDIDNVTHVINYDLPQTYDDYVHRIGRTGRAGKTGIALTFVT